MVDADFGGKLAGAEGKGKRLGGRECQESLHPKIRASGKKGNRTPTSIARHKWGVQNSREFLKEFGGGAQASWKKVLTGPPPPLGGGGSRSNPVARMEPEYRQKKPKTNHF